MPSQCCLATQYRGLRLWWLWCDLTDPPLEGGCEGGADPAGCDPAWDPAWDPPRDPGAGDPGAGEGSCGFAHRTTHRSVSIFL
eukprot:1191649-Prorocentrum_minimum.AAC.3